MAVMIRSLDKRRRILFFPFMLMLLGLMVATLTACSKSESGNREQFAAAINRAVGDSIFVTLEEMPRSEFERGYSEASPIAASQRLKPGDSYVKSRHIVFNNPYQSSCLAALVASGVLIPWREGYYTGQGPNDAPWDVYLFKASQHKRGTAFKIVGNVFWQFYCGRYAVDSITGWSKPDISNGETAISVTYRLKQIDAPEWAHGGSVDLNFRDERKAILILTPNGLQVR